jgi:hypothetical protein
VGPSQRKKDKQPWLPAPEVITRIGLQKRGRLTKWGRDLSKEMYVFSFSEFAGSYHRFHSEKEIIS